MRTLFLLLLSLVSLLALSSAQQCGKQFYDLLCSDNQCCSKKGFCGNTFFDCCDGCQSQCDCMTNIFNSSTFEAFLPNRNDFSCPAKDFYTFDDFLHALEKFPEFGTTGDMDTRKREIAAFFAQTSSVTDGNGPGYTWGYCHKEEEHPVGNYCVPCDRWPCVEDKKHFGRGPMMLSYNYNYGPAGYFLGWNLLRNPEIVSQDALAAFETALWFWMTPQPGKPSCHGVVVGNWRPTEQDKEAKRLPGYGVITNIINGEVECGKGRNHKVLRRTLYYMRYCNILGISYEANLDCYHQQPFPHTPPLCEPELKQSKATY